MLNPIILSLQNVTKVTRISKGLIFWRNVTKRSKKSGNFFFNGTTETNAMKGDPMLNPIIQSLQNVTKVTRISKGVIFWRNVTKRKGPKNQGPFFQLNDLNKCNKGRSNVKPYLSLATKM